MGEAKRRGTREDRIRQAMIKKVELEKAQRKLEAEAREMRRAEIKANARNEYLKEFEELDGAIQCTYVPSVITRKQYSPKLNKTLLTTALAGLAVASNFS